MNEPQNNTDQTPRSTDRASFCKYLRKHRESAKLSLDDIARVTRIPERSLERLECGRFEELPADVFVRGFLRSYANCVGIDPDDALRRYAECGLAPAPVASDEAKQLARRLHADAQPPVASGTASRVAPATPARAPAEAAANKPVTESKPVRPIKKRKAKKRRKARAREAAANATDAKVDAKVDTEVDAEVDTEVDAGAEPVEAAEPAIEVVDLTAAPEPPPRPVLVIDDADPDAAERARKVRTDESRVTFLPASLMDADDGSRRGALTLAVIILVIVATITMSYLLRRPSSPADGVTQLGPAQILSGGHGAIPGDTLQV